MPDHTTAKTLPPSPHGQLLRSLLPPVSYEPNAQGVVTGCTITGLTLDRAHAKAQELLNALNPYHPDWMEDYERVYGLPFACFAGPTTLDERILQLTVALRERYGISATFFYWLASVFGFAITIREYRPFTAGSRAGEPLTNGQWKYAWSIHTKEHSIEHFRAGRNVAGDPLQLWGNERFECFFREFAPAHGIVQFTYAQ